MVHIGELLNYLIIIFVVDNQESVIIFLKKRGLFFFLKVRSLIASAKSMLSDSKEVS